MNNFDYIFTQEQYEQLNQAYSKKLHQSTSSISIDLNSVVTTLEKHAFNLPTKLQAKIQNNLLQAKEILHLVYIADSTQTITINNNPFHLISILASISNKLNSYTIKSPYQTLFLKANELIISSIELIANNFENKLIKIFKYL